MTEVHWKGTMNTISNKHDHSTTSRGSSYPTHVVSSRIFTLVKVKEHNRSCSCLSLYHRVVITTRLISVKTTRTINTTPVLKLLCHTYYGLENACFMSESLDLNRIYLILIDFYLIFLLSFVLRLTRVVRCERRVTYDSWRW